MTDAEKIKLLQDTLEWMITDVKAWCEAIHEDGSSWDNWDNFYKGFHYRSGTTPSGIEQAQSALDSTRVASKTTGSTTC